MRHYWMHFKEDEERGLRESWYLKLSFSRFPSSGWLYELDNKSWWFRIYDTKHRIDIDFRGFAKREAMKRCVEILKLINKMEEIKK